MRRAQRLVSVGVPAQPALNRLGGIGDLKPPRGRVQQLGNGRLRVGTADLREDVDEANPQRRRLRKTERRPEAAIAILAFLVALALALHGEIDVLHPIEKLAD